MQLETTFGDDPANQPYAVRTVLGWSVAGPTKKFQKKRKTSAYTYVVHRSQNETQRDSAQPETDRNTEVETTDAAQAGPREQSLVPTDTVNLDRMFQQYLSMEKHGFQTGPKAMSIEDQRAMTILDSTTKFVDGRYEVGMLWKKDPPVLPNNRVQAERIVKQLLKRIQANPEFARKYKAVMDDYEAKGYARRLTKEEASTSSSITFYLTHHGVMSSAKPKLRVVFNAALEYAGISLNSQLLSGADLNNSLLGTIFRWREHGVVIVADIEAMFHRVKVKKEDCDALRFLWYGNGFDKPPVEYQMTSHIFGASDSPTVCTYALRRCAEDQRGEFSPEAVQAVFRNMYVDDLLRSESSISSATSVAHQLIEMLGNRGFNLTKFQSNRKEVLEALPSNRLAKSMDLDKDKLPVERALGLKWDIESDTIGVEVKFVHRPETRTGCLSDLSSTFDPIGITGPVTLIGKRILQIATQRKIGWHDPLPEDLLKSWQKWKSELKLLDGISIPRCYFTSESKSAQLHHFCDASETGYGTVSYLRTEFGDGRIEVAFVMAKCRTAPSQFITSAKLELQACVIQARVNSLIRSELDLSIDQIYFWSDSKIALQYIVNETRRFHTYVANRVAEIRDTTDPKLWRHCPGKSNPADCASRGISAKHLLSNKTYLQGPKFLYQREDQWPSEEIGELTQSDSEIKPDRIVMLALNAKTLDSLLTRYSSWTTLNRKVALLQKFVKLVAHRVKQKRDGSVAQRVKRRRGGDGSDPTPDMKLSVDDLDYSQLAIVRLVQGSAFADEIHELENGKPVKLSSPLRRLNPILVDGILRVGGRLKNAPIPFDAKYPLILPKDHHVTRLIITHYHVKLGHAGQNHVLSEMREKFWIVKGRSVVRLVLRKCITCRKYHAIKMTQIMSDLPEARLTGHVAPFTYTGVDYFGPLFVKRGRNTVKRYGCLFTCLQTRAVHLEKSNSLETTSFINALRRFIGRRGMIKQMWSDNGTNLVGGERKMRKSILEWNEHADEFLKQNAIEWHFQPPHASHMSGVWERLVKSVKRTLYAVLGSTLASDEVLETTLIETERMLNSRPLCPVSDDPRDLDVLTPNHFLLQKSETVSPPGLFVDADLYRKTWRQVQYISDCMWKRFLKEYIPALQERNKWLRKQRNLAVGDLVLITEQNVPRGHWLLGRVLKTFPGQDGNVRSVELKTKGSTLVRPIHKLCLLEANSG